MPANSLIESVTSFVPVRDSKEKFLCAPTRPLYSPLDLLPLACTRADRDRGDLPCRPETWVDKDTGHRVWRLSDQPNSGAFYFNINGFAPDNKQMVYTAPDGIHVLDLETRQTKLLVANPPGVADTPGVVHALVVGHKTNSVFYTATNAAGVTDDLPKPTRIAALCVSWWMCRSCRTPPA